jgi:hypothetical protein
MKIGPSYFDNVSRTPQTETFTSTDISLSIVSTRI